MWLSRDTSHSVVLEHRGDRAVNDTHGDGAVAYGLHPGRVMIPTPLSMFATLSLCAVGLLGCVDTYCQSGAKYGTQCYSMTDVRTPPGQRPPLSNEPPLWYKGPPPPTRYG